ncbi:MAG: hypothetical protein KJP17_03160 [Gammaproteobacteria bacterium]|nr:hypothetical protein [Gammaproteobacteria bacterium]
MSRVRLVAVLITGFMLSACGGNDTKEVVCKNDLRYQNRVVGKRIVAPQGLDQLDEYKEMPVPQADPDAPQPAPGTCDDMPPVIQVGT